MRVKSILNNVVEAFKNINGIEAIVLGGSRATKTATDFSDIDIGIYYNDEFDIATFKTMASRLDDKSREDCITNLGEWGPWINGGGWLTIDDIAVDILFRDIKKVTKCIEDCKNGIITIDYQCGHPFGFLNSIYMAEVFSCEILHSNSNKVQKLKKSLQVFPDTYKNAATERFLWECEFSLMCGRKAVKKEDLIYATGSIFRSSICLIYVLYAINEMYCLNEKGSLDRLVKSDDVILPMNFKETIERSNSIDKNNILMAFEEMDKMYNIIREMIMK